MRRSDGRLAIATVLATMGFAVFHQGCASPASEATPAPVVPADAGVVAADASTGETDAGALPATLKATGETCAKNKECASKKCSPEKTCAAPACDDAKQNGDELGIDCGGACAKCDGASCAASAECLSGFCDAVCGPMPDKLCGVGLKSLCANGMACEQDADCSTIYCVEGVCGDVTADAHSDGRQNAGETDVDCGGTSGTPCNATQKCKVSDDCVSTCAGTGVCNAPSDTDGKKNNGETDVDCGGPNGKKCGTAKVCAASSDCGLGFCSLGTCVVPTAGDGVKNGTETDVDCGGAAVTFDGVTVPAGPKCALTKACAGDSDCESTVCTENKICIEAPSCRQIHGGQTCGAGEYAQPGAQHESCCKSLKVPGLTVTVKVAGVDVVKSVYLDKYEITSGRIREWIKSIRAQYAGVANIQQWVTDRVAIDPLVATMFSKNNAINFLPKQDLAQYELFTKPDTTQEAQDMGLLGQLGPESYYRGVQVGGTSGCYMGSSAFGHRTYWYTPEQSGAFLEPARTAASQEWLDEKSMNCMTPVMFAAFCAWDGGYIQSQAAIAAAYGPAAWPWGASPTPQDEVAKIANWNNGTGGFGATKEPRYLWPSVNYATFSGDLSPIIASPGRFVGDKTTVTDANGESWMDLGGNMIEWSHNAGNYHGWTGASFEGHSYPRAWTGGIYFLDKYGKGGSRCMRLR